MNYYIVKPEVAETLKLTNLRHTAKDGRYILNASDLAPLGIENVLKNNQANPISEGDAELIIKGE